MARLDETKGTFVPRNYRIRQSYHLSGRSGSRALRVVAAGKQGIIMTSENKMMRMDLDGGKSQAQRRCGRRKQA